LLIAQSSRSARPFSINETGKTLALETMNPVLHRSRRIAKKVGYTSAAYTLCYEQNTVQPMVIP
jgi:hypothetical protein